MANVAIITGASSGIGREIALLLANNINADGPEFSGFSDISELWLVARRRDRLLELATEINSSVGFSLCRVFDGDITDNSFCASVSSALVAEGLQVSLLVNSAGCGFSGAFSSVPVTDNCACTDLNCTALVRFTGTILPYIMNGGRIVQLASAAAFFPQPDFAVYAASKSFVFSFSRALGRELLPRHISVTTACPGPCDTEFLALANRSREIPAYKKHFIVKSSVVARKILRASHRRRKLCLPTFSMKLLYVARKIIPDEWVIALQKF